MTKMLHIAIADYSLIGILLSAIDYFTIIAEKVLRKFVI